MRVLRNRVVNEWTDRAGDIPADAAERPVIGHFDLLGARMDLHKFDSFVPMDGATTGDLGEMPLLAGQGVGLISAIEPAREVIERMVAQAAGVIGRAARQAG
jgi:enoyl-[acyl-carrier protein] reductase II